MDRRLEFCQWYKSRLLNCLEEDKLYLELALCSLGIEYTLRQKELLMITWEQIDFKNKVIKDVKISKRLYPEQKEFLSYGDLAMTDEIYAVLIKYSNSLESKNGRLFQKNILLDYYSNIQESIGAYEFHGQKLRSMGITLKLHKLRG